MPSVRLKGNVTPSERVRAMPRFASGKAIRMAAGVYYDSPKLAFSVQ